MSEFIYIVSVHYHDYTFNNAADAITFTKLAISGGDKSADIKIVRKETAENEETEHEEG